jgi:predicted ATP-dependent Lon-type protease
MTDITKYRNVSLTHETYKEGHFLSTVLFDGLQVSMSQLIESLISKKIEELNLKDKVAQYDEPKKIVHKKKKKAKKLNGKLKDK